LREIKFDAMSAAVLQQGEKKSRQLLGRLAARCSLRQRYELTRAS
jgi:hypothetical protein